MQVYAALYDSIGNFIVVKKAIKNCFWEGNVTSKNKVVNQAGQWAFPGGKKEPKDKTNEDCALREVFEETGVRLSDYHFKSYKILSTDLYELWGFELGEDDINKIQNSINLNLTPSMADSKKPTSNYIIDWELQYCILVHYKKLLYYLGLHIEVSPNFKKEIDDAVFYRPYSQEIGWYKEMAQYIEKNFRPINA